MDLVSEEQQASQGEGSPKKRLRVQVPEFSEQQEASSSSVHGATLMGKIARQCLTKAIRSAEELQHLKQGLAAISIHEDDGSLLLPIGSACSGTDIWAHNLEAFFEAAHLMFDIEVPHVRVEFACDNCPKRQKFLREQFADLEMIVPDCSVFSEMKTKGGVADNVHNIITGKPARLPHARGYGAGFSCTSISNCHNGRKEFSGCVREHKGATGITFWHQHSYIVRYRPVVSVLENVPNLAQEVALEGGTLTSDLKYINESFEKKQMASMSTIMNRKTFGSPQEGLRLFIAVFDILPKTAEIHNVEGRILAFIQRLCEPEVLSPNAIMLDDDQIDAIGNDRPDSKRASNAETTRWLPDHQVFFEENGLAWPPGEEVLAIALSGYKSFRPREAEVVFAAHLIYPCEPQHRGRWQFFDANCTMQRVFGWPPGVDKEGNAKKIKNPWKVDTLPCQVGSSVMAGRHF